MTTLFVTSKKRSVLWRNAFQIELTVVFVGLAVYALLVSINLRASLFVIMIAALTGGQRSHSSRRLQPPPVRGAPLPVELGRIYSGPNRDRCDLRCGRGSLPGVDQS